MTFDRRKTYYALAGAIARDESIEFQRRYLAGLAYQRTLRLRVSRCASLESFLNLPAPGKTNVLTLRRKQS